MFHEISSTCQSSLGQKLDILTVYICNYSTQPWHFCISFLRHIRSGYRRIRSFRLYVEDGFGLGLEANCSH